MRETAEVFEPFNVLREHLYSGLNPPACRGLYGRSMRLLERRVDDAYWPVLDSSHDVTLEKTGAGESAGDSMINRKPELCNSRTLREFEAMPICLGGQGKLDGDGQYPYLGAEQAGSSREEAVFDLLDQDGQIGLVKTNAVCRDAVVFDVRRCMLMMREGAGQG